jgi:hypothetical protein
MSTGIKIYAADGSLILDGTTRVGRVLGNAMITPGANGSFPDNRFSQGTPFLAYQRDRTFPLTAGKIYVRPPYFTYSANRWFWTFPAQGSTFDEAAGGMLFFGVF